MVKVELETKEKEVAQTKQLPRKKRRLFRRLFVFLLLMLAIIGLLFPQILSNSSIRQHLTSVLMKDFQGQIDIETADLAWWKPVEISSLTMLDQQGVEIAKVESAKISTPLWRLFWPDDEPLVLEVKKPEIVLTINKYGSNWQRLFPQKDKKQSSDQEFTWPEFQHNSKPIKIRVIDGRITVKDLVSKRTVELRNLQMMLEKSPKLVTGNMQGETLLVLETKSQLPAGKVNARFQLALANKKAVAGEVNAQVENTPLELIQPWLKQMMPHLHLSAETTDAKINSKWTGNLKSGLKLELTGELTAKKTALQSTEWLKNNQVNAQDLSGKFHIDNTLPNIPGTFDLQLIFEQCKIDPLSESNADHQEKDPFSRIANQHKPLAPSVDLETLLIQSSGTIDGPHQKIALQKCKLQCKPCSLEIEGTVEQSETSYVLDLQGKGTGDIMPFIMIALPEIRESFQVKKLTPEEFAIRGEVASSDTQSKEDHQEEPSESSPEPSDEAPPVLSAVSKWSWDTIESYGVVSHQGKLWTKYEDEQLRIVPIKIPIGQRGEFLAKSVLDFRNDQRILKVESGPVLKNVEFSDSMTRSWLQYVSPIFADATDLQGLFSLETEATQIDLDSGQPQKLQGTLKIHSCKLGPGPAIRKATAPVTGLTAMIGSGRSTPEFLKPGSNWIELPRQDVHFMLKENRIYHDQLLFQAGQVKIISGGSVGLDQTLDTKIIIPLDFVKGNDKPLLGFLKQQQVEIHLRGTLNKPEVDTSKMADFSKQMGTNAIDNLIKGLLDKRRKKKNK